MTRREFLATAAVAAWTRPGTPAKPQNSFYFVLIDTSLTIVNFEEYRNAWRTIENHFQGGDRMVIALVKGQVPHQPSTTFRKIDSATDKLFITLTIRKKIGNQLNQSSRCYIFATRWPA